MVSALFFVTPLSILVNNVDNCLLVVMLLGFFRVSEFINKFMFSVAATSYYLFGVVVDFSGLHLHIINARVTATTFYDAYANLFNTKEPSFMLFESKKINTIFSVYKFFVWLQDWFCGWPFRLCCCLY